MTAQLKHMILGRRGGTLREAKPISIRPAVVCRGRVEVDHCLRGSGALGRGGCGFGGRARAVLVAVMALLVVVVTAPVASADPVGQISEFSTGLNAHSNPIGVVSGSDGNLWFTDEGTTSAIGRITPTGQITEFSAGLDAASRPYSIAAGPDGNLWFTDLAALMGGTSAIGRITPSGQITEYSNGLNPDSLPVGIAAGPDGNLWFTDDGTTPAIGRITPSGQITEYSYGHGLNAGSLPDGIAAGPDGNLWFTDPGAQFPGGTSAIGRITPSGQITEYSYGHGLNAGSLPGRIAAGADGNLWFTDEGTTPAIGRITPSGQITEYSYGHGLNGGSSPTDIAAGPDGNLWFTDEGTTPAIGRITPSGQITEYSYGHGLNAGSSPAGIAAGPDGNLWFTDEGTTSAIGRIGTGAPSALQAPASVSGAGRAGSPESCQVQWPVWAGSSPMAGLYPFDGYAWLRDGTPIAGQTTATYTPTGADVGHQLACRATVTYSLPFSVTANATSAAVTIQAAPPPPQPPTPALAALTISPRMFTLRGRRVGGRCEPRSHSNRGHHPCTRRVALTARFTLNTTATVTLALERALPGRMTRGHCTPPTHSDRRHRACTRLVTLPGTMTLPGVAGADVFTVTGAISGHRLEPGSYRLLATPTTGARTGNQQQTTFEITP
jgi:streptogramin lyase